MSYSKPVYIYNNALQYVFNTYLNTDLIDFKDNHIELHMNNYESHLHFKILIDYNGDLITKRRDDNDKLGNYININSPNKAMVKRLKLEMNIQMLKNYYSNLNDFEELRKLSKIGQVSSHSLVEWKDYRLDIWSIYLHTCINMVYVVSDESNKIISIMLCDESFQLGDCETYVYLINGEHILVYNAGVIWSTIVIKHMIN